MAACDDPVPGPTSAGGPALPGVTRVRPAATLPLRALVLRPGLPPEDARFPADDHPDAAAFAATDGDGRVVGVAIVSPDACPWRPTEAGAWRLRGMATDERWRGTGIGRRVLDAVLDHVADQRGTLVWCNARVPARRFYERAGFTVRGDEWDEPGIGPHIAMARPL